MTASHVIAILGALLLAPFALQVAAGEPARPGAAPQVVSKVDLNRYAGKWYEIARFPNRFQDHCTGEVTANYVLRDDGRIAVINECRTAKGADRAEGVARVATDDGSNAKLKVRFAPAFLSWLPVVWGDYWILDLDEDYRFVLVGSPDRKYLWILARTPSLDEASYERLVAAATARGFDATRLVRTPQAAATSN